MLSAPSCSPGHSHPSAWHRRLAQADIPDRLHERLANSIVPRRLLFLSVVLAAAICITGCRSTQSRAFRGPINQGFKPPVVIIVSTQEKPPELNAEIHEYILSLQSLPAFRDAQVMTDREALETDLSGKSLLVYGTPCGNAFLAKHLARLPLVIDADGVEFSKRIKGDNLRVITTWPNPQDSSRAMAIYTAQQARDVIGINAVFHGPEDFLITRRVDRGSEVLYRGLYRKNNGRWSDPIPLPMYSTPWDFAYTPSRLAVSGNPEEIGREIGAGCAETLAEIIPLAMEQIKSDSRLQSDQEIYAKASQIEATLDPRDVAEMQAIAKAAGLDYRDVLSLNLYYNLTAPGLACSQIAVWGEASVDGRLLHGRNLDWPDTPNGLLSRNHLILNVKPEGGIEYVLLTWPGYTAAVTGANRAGLTVAANVLMPPSKGRRKAEPTFFTLKRILRTCRTIEEAVEEIRRVRPADDMSILISDADAPAAVVVELWGGRVRLREPAEGESIIGNANYPTTFACWYPGVRRSADWPTCDISRQIGLPLDVDRMQHVLGNGYVIQEMNLVSVIFDPTMNRMFLSCRQFMAARGTFAEYPLFSDQQLKGRSP